VSHRAGGGRRTLIVLASLFVAPLALAFWLYYGTSWRPLASTNRGELITPARPLPEAASLQRAGGARIFSGKWSLVIVSTDDCDAVCRAGLHYAQRTLASLGRLQARTQLVLVHGSACCSASPADPVWRDLLRVDARAAPGLLGVFPEPQRAQMIFVVDPLGNLMMRYDSSRDPKGLREDLQHLLDLSGMG
jgi:hypothetical protein